MIEYSLVPFHVVSDYIASVSIEHHEEVNKRDGIDGLDIDWDYLFEAGKVGACLVSVPTDKGKIIGYSGFFISQNALNKKIVEADSVAFFIEKEYRGKIADEFMAKTEEFLKKIGVNRINYLLKNGGIGRILKKRGYNDDYKQWSIEL